MVSRDILIRDRVGANNLYIQGTKIARVRVIFTLPDKLDRVGQTPAPSWYPKQPLAFVEWYSPLRSGPLPRDGMMYKIKKAKTADNKRMKAAIIPLNNIRQSCMLFPYFGLDTVPIEWTSNNVLDKAEAFYINNWASKYAYQTIY